MRAKADVRQQRWIYEFTPSTHLSIMAEFAAFAKASADRHRKSGEAS
jgi:hypothetical protein